MAKAAPSQSKRSPARDAQAADSLGQMRELIWDLGRAYYAYVGLIQRVLAEQRLDHILRPGMGLILFALYEEDSRTIKELAARSQLACSTLTGLLTRMEKAGLVVRQRDSQDGRLVRVSLTSLGRSLKSKCHAMAREVAEVAQRGVGQQNVAQVNAMLQDITAAFRSEEQRLSAANGSARGGSGQDE